MNQSELQKFTRLFLEAQVSWDKNLRILSPRGERITSINRLLALSRRTRITVCERCGSMKALEDAGFYEEKADRRVACCERRLVLINPILSYGYISVYLFSGHVSTWPRYPSVLLLRGGW